MAINTIQGYNLSGKEPIDIRYTASNAAARLAYNDYASYEGLTVYQRDTGEYYILTNSSAPSNPSSWRQINIGIDTGSFLTTSSFNSWTGSSVSQFAGTASYIAPIFISASAASYGFGSGGGTSVSGNGFPYDGRTTPARITGSLILSGSGTVFTVTGSILMSGSLGIGDTPNSSTALFVPGRVRFGQGSNTRVNTRTMDVGGNINLEPVSPPNSTIAQIMSSSISVTTGGNIGKTGQLQGTSLSTLKSTDTTARYFYQITFVTAEGETSAFDFNVRQGLTSTPYADVTQSNSAISIKIPASPDIRVTSRKLWRSRPGTASITAPNFAAVEPPYCYELATIAGNSEVTYLDTISEAAQNITNITRHTYRAPNTTAGLLEIGAGNRSLLTYEFGTTLGVRAGALNTRGDSFVAIGTDAAYSNRTGNNSVSIGYQAAYANAFGSNNIAIGYTALYQNVSGSSNTAVGDSALRTAIRTDTTLNYNTAIGAESLGTINHNAQYNVGIGFRTGVSITGSGNTYLGSQAGNRFNAAGQFAGDYNVYIGYNTGNQHARNINSSNNILIGKGVNLPGNSGSNLLNIGNLIYANRLGIDSTLSTAGTVYLGGLSDSALIASSPYRLVVNGSTNITNNLTVTGSVIGNVRLTGSLFISGSIIPNADASRTSSFELGSPTAAWNRIWVRSSSIHFVDDSGNELAKISANPAGQVILPNIYTAGTFTAQTFVTQSTTTIVQVYHATGSNIFGSSSLDTHQFTGSIYVSGAMYVSDVPEALGTNVLTYNPSTGRLYYTSSTALIGPQGPAGPTGATGPAGATGPEGPVGQQGNEGAPGVSSYQSWLNLGNVGTEQDFINSLFGSIGTGYYITAPVTSSMSVLSASFASSASYTLTASYALNAGGGTGVGFPYDGRTTPAIISGSLIVTGSGITVTGSLLVSGTINRLEIGTGKGNNITNVAIGAGAGNKFTAAGTSGVSNVALGSASLANTTNGSDNTGIGVATLQSLTTGTKNIAIGPRSLSTITTAFSNIGIGIDTLASTNADANIAIGESALNNNTTGFQNVAIGTYALASKLANKSNIVAIGSNSARNFSGEDSAFIGTEAGRYATGSYSIAIGPYAARYANGYSYSIALGYSALEGIASSPQPFAITQFNTAIGYQSMQYYVSQSNSIGIGTETLRGRPAWPLGFGHSGTAAGYSYNIAIGRSALEFLTRGGGNTAIGYNSLQATAANTFNTASQLDNNTAIGAYALNRTLSGIGNSFIGFGSGRFLTSGSNNTAIGYLALSSTAANPGAYTQNVAIGFSAMTNIQTGSYNVGIGTNAFISTQNASYNVGIGVNAFYANINGQQNVAIGYNAYRNAESGSYNIAIGTEAALDGLNSGNRGIVIGFRAGYRLHARRANQTDINSVVIGTEAMADTSVNSSNFTSVSNTVIGDRALYKTRAGSYNVGIGANVMYNSTTGQYNTILGYNAMASSSFASYNVVIGSNTVNSITTGNYNVILGYQAGEFLNTTSANNVIIGPGAGPRALTVLNNKLYIASGSGNPLIAGDFAAKTVTISGSLLMSGSIIPSVDSSQTSSFSLGSPTAAWRDIHVSDGTIYFYNGAGTELSTIKATAAGQIEIPNIYTAGTFTAQTFVTQSTTTIVEVYHATGSNIFGSSSLDTHQFTGSVFVSGAFYISDVQQSVGSNVLTYNPNSGRLYYTASSALIGPQGPTGTSTYQSWLNLGNTGTEQDFINYLKGATGETGPIGPTGPVGETGPEGAPGENGITVTDLFVNIGELLWNTTASIQFSGSVNSLYGYTGSLFGTSSWSNYSSTASYISPVFISASVASAGFGAGGSGVGFPFNGNAVITGSLQLGNQYSSVLFNTTQSVINSTTTTVYSVNTSSYDALFVDYIIKSGSNMRSGQLTTSWLSSSIVYSETCTVDIGSTTGTDITPILTGSLAAIRFTAPSNTWTIKVIARSI